ncbi:MAG TPA: hypothetical protein VK540_08035 [Polyangiaceae bacterium]|nr:hypothetical protein [Polyangiaceae bacterium]
MAVEVVPSASGISVLDLRAALEEIVGKDVVVKALASLPAATRAEFVEITALSWVPLATITLVINAVAATARVNPERLIDDAVRRAVERTFKTVWRVMLRFTTDAALIARTPVVYSLSRNIGRLRSRILSPGKAEVTLSDWPGVSARHVRTLGVSIVTVVTLAGRKEASVTSSPTADGAMFLLTWRV